MFYALVVICTVSGSSCATAEDRRGPYPDAVACAARQTELAPAMTVAAELHALRWGEPVRVWQVCDRLARIRALFPDAFAAIGEPA